MRTPLNDAWRFKAHFDASPLLLNPKEMEEIDLPHNAVSLPYHEFDESLYQKSFAYLKDFDDPEPSLPSKILRFDGIMLKAKIYLNDEFLGEYISGFLPLSLDLSGKIKKKGNRIVLIVNGEEDPLIPPFGHIVDYLTFAGIYRKVSLDSFPASYIADIYPFASKDGKVKLQVSYVNYQGGEKATFSLYDGEKLLLKTKDEEFRLNHIEPWSIDNPKLYTLKATYGEQIYERKIGFRDVEWKEEGFFLNGKKIKLIGLNRHQSFPYIGMAAPSSLQEEDARILKDAGINVVRTSHYADDESFLDECDRLGLLLIDEIPGWQHIGKETKWRETCIDFAKRLVLKERHHPCLIAYGLRIDESPDDHDLYGKINEIQKELDPHRASTGVRNFKDSELLEDIFGYNDFSCRDLSHGLDNPKTYPTAKGKPKLVTENNGHMYPTKMFDPTARRIEHALRHSKVADDAFGYDNLCGEIAWCAFDYNTHSEFGSGDRICYHGVFDIFRNPKYASYFYGTLKEEPFLEVCSTLDKGDESESLLKPFVVFTNLDFVELYKNGTKIGRFLPDRKNYPNLPHPPIFVDDFIGDTLDDPRFNPKERKFLAKALNSFSATGGIGGLSFKEKAAGLKLLAKHHLIFNDLSDFYNKYMGEMKEGDYFSIRGYRKGKLTAEKTIGISRQWHLDVKCPEELCNGETYDAKRVSLIKRNEFGMQAYYSFDPIIAETEGPIQILGPKEFSLIGGASCLFVRSLPVKKPTIAKLILRHGNDRIEKEIVVK